MAGRLSLALGQGGLALPETGTIAVFHPRAGADIADLPRDRTVIIQPFFPDHAAFREAGYICMPDCGEPCGPFAAALVFVPRAKALARALVAQATAATTTGVVIVDGAKTDGIDSVLREIRNRVEVSGPLAKSHGKIFWFTAQPAFADWEAPAAQTASGFVTAAGLFSADGIDPASQLLADALPQRLGRHVVDLGAGWGYLSARILADRQVETLDLVEADYGALACARRNLSDARARFHWADARSWTPPGPVDTVVTNPPFHSGRAADPALGRGFIEAAARILSPSGTLWLVANRQLPYETALTARFHAVEEVGGDNRFKIFRAARPSRPRR